MGSDAIANAAPLPAFSKDSKKKRTNRLAKLKQSKLDVRREQWLSHVKNNSCNKVDRSGLVDSPPSSVGGSHKGCTVLENLQRMGAREDEHEILSRQDSELESLMSSSIGSSFSHDGSGKDSPGSNSSSSSGCCSGSVSEEERDEGSPDDWEAVADAELSTYSNHQTLNTEQSRKSERESSADKADVASENNRENTVETSASRRDPCLKGNKFAWTPDDAFRPQDLPDISKQQSGRMNSARCCSQGAKMWSWGGMLPQPSPCPICCEDLDVTDSSFLPCPCGFRLCLFCHKRILEEDGRCPGCRKQYESVNVDSCFIARTARLQISGSWGRKLRF
ncbi:hypothetical protein Ancab_034342 [Ancistrocladus abbreviatus]